MTAPFDPDFFDQLFNRSTASTDPIRRQPAEKPLPQIHGKRIDGVLYLHAGDIADALESQGPKTNGRLISRIKRHIGVAP